MEFSNSSNSNSPTVEQQQQQIEHPHTGDWFYDTLTMKGELLIHTADSPGPVQRLNFLNYFFKINK
jgi:hypothetical protein